MLRANTMYHLVLHAQKENTTEAIKEEDNQRLIFDDTKDSPAIYEKRLEVPAFLRKQQDR